jgi:hypothetical protein
LKQQVPSSLHLFEELVTESLRIEGACEVLDVIGETANDRHLRSKASESNFSYELGIIIRFERGQRGNVCRHRAVRLLQVSGQQSRYPSGGIHQCHL